MNHIPQTKDNITLRDKAIFTGIIIILIVITTIFINQYYYNSIRDTLMPADFLIVFVTTDFDYDEAYMKTALNSKGS